jgi:hypothetical protein
MSPALASVATNCIGRFKEKEALMTSNLSIARAIKQVAVLLVLACGALAATSSPAGAFTTTSTSGAIGSRTPDVPAYPNKCFSKNFNSGQFTTTQVWVSRTSDSRYAKSVQYIGAWLNLKKYNGTTGNWDPVSIDGTTSTFMGWDETYPPSSTSSPVTTLTSGRVEPLTIYNLTPGWYRVEFQYHWWVQGPGYVGYAKDVFNNDTYRRFLGVSLNSGPDSVTSVGSCYVD